MSSSDKLKKLEEFLASKVKVLREELEQYEALLSLISDRARSTLKASAQELGKDARGEESSIVEVHKLHDGVEVELLVGVKRDELNLEDLKSKLKILSSKARLSVEYSDAGEVESLVVRGVTGSIADGVAALLKSHVEELMEKKKRAGR